MKVYVVENVEESSDFDDGKFFCVVGVYSDKKKAEKVCAMENAKKWISSSITCFDLNV